MAMTLEQVRDGLFACSKGHGFDDNQIDTLHGFERAIDAHLSQPAQAVDVGAIRRVVDELKGYCEASDDSCYGTLSTSLVHGYMEALTRAIGNAQAEGN